MKTLMPPPRPRAKWILLAGLLVLALRSAAAETKDIPTNAASTTSSTTQQVPTTPQTIFPPATIRPMNSASSLPPVGGTDQLRNVLWGSEWYYRQFAEGRIDSTTKKQTFCFPLGAPALGFLLPPPPQGAPSASAARLQPYVAEPFFTPLSSLLQWGDVSRRRLEMLKQYRELKLQVVKSLSSEIAAAQAMPSAARRDHLASLAQSQTEEVSRVEALAEEIRLDLLHGRMFEGWADWEGSRKWYLDDPSQKTSAWAQFEVLHAAAAFGGELSLEQRGLLQEMAMELAEHTRAGASAMPESEAESFLYFTPGTSRFRLPSVLPEAVRARVAAYRKLKNELKNELREAVFASERSSTRQRAATFKTLRNAQVARLTEMAALAEEIRVGLVDLALPGEPPSSPIPVSLAPQIADYLGAKVAVQRAFVAKLAEVRAAVPQAQAEIVRGDAGYRIKIGGANRAAETEIPVLQTLPEFHRVQARRYAELVAMKKALVQAMKATPAQPLEANAGSIDELLQGFSAAQRQRENWNKYWLYRQAVLEPGLSEGQRRLLFSAAVESIVAPYVR